MEYKPLTNAEFEALQPKKTTTSQSGFHRTIGTQTEKKPFAVEPIDTVVEMFNGLFLKIKDNQKDIQKFDKELEDIVEDIYNEIYDVKKIIMKELREEMRQEIREEIMNATQG